MRSALLSLLFAAAATQAAAAADAAVDGRALARQWCSSCHVVEPGGRGSDAAPPFADIARRHSGDRSWIRAWLTDPHPPMKGITLSRRQIDDIIAYLDTMPQK